MRTLQGWDFQDSVPLRLFHLNCLWVAQPFRAAMAIPAHAALAAEGTPYPSAFNKVFKITTNGITARIVGNSGTTTAAPSIINAP